MYCASVSASRSVKLRACANTSSTVSIASLSHSSDAMDMKRRANFCLRLRTVHHGVQLVSCTFYFHFRRSSSAGNRERAPSGPVKVVATNQPHSRRHTGVDLVSGVSALLAWFPASWASKIAPCFIGEEGGPIQARKRFPLLVPIEFLRGYRERRLTQYCRRLSSLTKTLLD